MKKKLALLGAGALLFSMTAFNALGKNDYSGSYKGVYWSGHSKGVALEEAKKKIETTLTLDKDGTILDVKTDFLVLKNGEWKARNNPGVVVSVDFSVDPIAAIPGSEYKEGTLMFNIKTNDMISFYAVAVDADGTVALAISDAVIRYQLETKFGPGYDFNSKIKDLTINSGLIPTKRTSKGGLLKPKEWSELEGKSVYKIHPYNNVIKDRGVLKGIDDDSTVMELLTALGVKFKEGIPRQTDVKYGFHSNGGWEGNYKALREYLIGKNANDIKSLIDWSSKRYSGAVNEDNYFGIDIAAGATKTIQNSYDGIGGSTVRMSRENTTYMLALVEAGILKEEDVIKGRF